MVKRCAWGSCNTDSRYPERLKTEDGKTIKFHSFPQAKKYGERREVWIKACCRHDGFVCTKDSYICSLHFFGKLGPTEDNPHPISATASIQKVARLSRGLSRKRKERIRETDEKSAAKSLLMLNYSTSYTGKSADEICVAEILVYLADMILSNHGYDPREKA